MNRPNAQSGWRRTTYFESTSANVSYSAPATMWLNVWNCDGGCSWKRIGTYTLNPRYWGSWGLEGTAWYHAGVDSSVPQVEYALRYRDAFPLGFHQTSEYPFDGAYDYTERIQGIAHSPNGYWYVTQEWAAYKIPVGSPLGASGQATAATGIPAPLGAYHHMGGADFYNGRLYVPMEGSTPAIAVFDSNLKLDRIQGGAFSPKCHLYLVMDVAGHGVKGFEVRSGRQYANIPVNFDPSWDTQEELEGIDIWDLDNGAAPGVNGQIHVLMLDNDLGSDELFFKHYSVTNAGEKGNL